MFKNNRVKLEKQNPKNIKESYLMNEDDDLDFLDDDSEGEVDPAGEDEFSDDEFSDDTTETDVTGEEGSEGLESLGASQQKMFDDEIDELLSPNLDDFEDDSLEEADGFDDDGFEDEDTFAGENGVEVETDEFENDSVDYEGDDDDFVSQYLSKSDLNDIIASPDSFSALENDLVSKIENEEGGDDDFSFDDDEDEELIESVLATNLKNSDFELETPSKLEKKPSAVSNASIKGGADQKTSGGLKKMQQESVRKSKMLVEASLEIESKTKELNRKNKALNKASVILAEQKKLIAKNNSEVAKLKFENEKLRKVNGILSSVGEKLSKDASKNLVEGFNKCANKAQVDALYAKVVNVIKSKLRPSINESVSKVKTNIKQVKQIKESKEVNNEQNRKDLLMGINNDQDAYYA